MNKVTTIELFNTTKEGFEMFMKTANLKKYTGSDLWASHTTFYVNEDNVVHAELSTSSWNSDTEYRISERDNGDTLSFLTTLINSKT